MSRGGGGAVVEAFAARRDRVLRADPARPGHHGDGRGRTRSSTDALRSRRRGAEDGRGEGHRNPIPGHRTRPVRCGATPTRRCRSAGPCTGRWLPSTWRRAPTPPGARRADVARARAAAQGVAAHADAIAAMVDAALASPTVAAGQEPPALARALRGRARRRWRPRRIRRPRPRGRRRADGGRLQDRPHRRAGRAPPLPPIGTGPRWRATRWRSRRPRGGRCARCVLVFVGDGDARRGRARGRRTGSGMRHGATGRRRHPRRLES